MYMGNIVGKDDVSTSHMTYMPCYLDTATVTWVFSHVFSHGLSPMFQVLDEEAEVFIVKMWRLLIYETESKKIGLVK